jgi:hypothetical protein
VQKRRVESRTVHSGALIVERAMDIDTKERVAGIRRLCSPCNNRGAAPRRVHCQLDNPSQGGPTGNLYRRFKSTASS